MIRKIILGLIQTLKSYSITEIALTVIFAVFFVYALLNILIPSYGPGSEDVYIEGAVGKVISPNPLFSDLNDIDRDITRLVFSGLVKYYPDTQDFRPDLADYTVSDDGITYTFIIKEGVKWHDGEDFTAQDVYYTFHDVIQSEDFQNSILRSNFSKVSIEKKDDRTIAFKLNEPNSYFISDMTIGILPYHILKNTQVDNIINADFNKKPVGTGPFEFKSYNITSDGAKIILKKFDDYYGKQPGITTVEFLVYLSSDTLIKNISNIDAIPKVTSDFADDLRSNELIKMVSYAFPQYTALFLNTNHESLKDRDIRIALAKSININELAGMLKDREAVGVGFFETTFKDKLFKYDIAKIESLLDAKDYKIRDKNNKYRKNKQGLELNIPLLLLQYQPKSVMEEEAKKAADYISKKWEAIGVKTEIDFLPQDQFNEAVKNNDYGAVVVGESFSYNMDPFSFWYSTQAASNQNTSGGLNFSNYTNYSVDKLIEDMKILFGKDKRAQRLTQIVNYFREDAPVIFLYRPLYYYVTDSKFKNGGMTNFVYSADRFWNISDWVL